MPPRKKNTALRLAVPIVGLLIGVGVVAAVIASGGSTPEPDPADTPAAGAVAEGSPGTGAPESAATPPPDTEPPDTEPGDTADATPVGATPPEGETDPDATDAPAAADASPSTESSPADPPADAAPSAEVATGTLTARVWDERVAGKPEAEGYTPIGSLDPEADHAVHLGFSRWGVGVRSLELADEFVAVGSDEHVALQSELDVNGSVGVPFALYTIVVDGTPVDLSGLAATGPVWQERAPGRFVAEVIDAEGTPVLDVERRYVLRAGRHDWRIEQTVTNRTNRTLTVSLRQTGPIDLAKAKTSYGGDKRRVRFGYLLAPEAQGTDPAVSADSALDGRRSILGSKDKATDRYPARHPVWPNEKATETGRRLVWAAFTDRYFAVAVHTGIDADNAKTPENKLFDTVDRIDRVIVPSNASSANDAAFLMMLEGTPEPIPAGKAADFHLGVYSGPMSKKVVRQDPLAVALGLDNIVAYNFGGFCAPCTFPFLTHLLLGVLQFYHSFTLDWAVAIVLLVITVRTCLHPITRWSQIRMQRFGVQMQAIGPKQKLLREKFKDDPKRMQAEMTRLWREEGISPAGMLGCLPMFLQSPVWIALYATLFFAAELRHQPAFFGIFQKLTGGSWQFLADLSAPDRAVPLGAGIDIPLMGHVDSINLLPILLGFVFFVHQKYLTPPTSATMTPEQESQQKMIKIMSVLMFPIFMYAAPSGLAIYFITNSSLAILENKWIRAHMNKHGMLDADKIRDERKKKAKKGGFLQRLMAAAEEQRAAREGGQGAGFGMGRSGKSKAPQGKPRKKTIDRKYKKRGS